MDKVADIIGLDKRRLIQTMEVKPETQAVTESASILFNQDESQGKTLTWRCPACGSRNLAKKDQLEFICKANTSQTGVCNKALGKAQIENLVTTNIRRMMMEYNNKLFCHVKKVDRDYGGNAALPITKMCDNKKSEIVQDQETEVQNTTLSINSKLNNLSSLFETKKNSYLSDKKDLIPIIEKCENSIKSLASQSQYEQIFLDPLPSKPMKDKVCSRHYGFAKRINYPGMAN